MTTLFGILGIVIALAAFGGWLASRYMIAKPTEAIIVTGRNKGKDTQEGQKVVIGAGVLVLPFVQNAERISLTSQEISIKITGVPSNDGILLDVTGIAVIKIGGDVASVRAAAQRFGSDLDEIRKQTTETLAGALRNIVGTMTVKELIQDRDGFSQKAVDSSRNTLNNQGLSLDTFQINSINDNVDYLVNLGREEQARQKREAEIAESDNQRIALEKKLQDRRVASDLQRDVALVESKNKQEREIAETSAKSAGPIEGLKQKQEILAQQIEANKIAAQVKEEQLNSEVRKVADANRYKMEQNAEAEKFARIAKAEAERDALIKHAEAQTQQDKLTGEGKIALAKAEEEEATAKSRGNLALKRAEAEGIQALGLAEAESIKAKGLADAEAMEKRAKAFEQYGEAAVLEILGGVMKDVAGSMAGAYSNIDNITIMGSNGTQEFGNSLSASLATVKQSFKDGVGLDIDNVLDGFGIGTKKSNEESLADEPVLDGEVIQNDD